MSLLIDALRKAEQAKQGTAIGGAAPNSASPGELDGGAQAKSAQLLFEVKAPPRGIGFALALGVGFTLASAAIAIYVWSQLQSAGPRLTAPALPAPAQRAAAADPAPATNAAPAPDPAPERAARPRPAAAPQRGSLGDETPAQSAAPSPTRPEPAAPPRPLVRRLPTTETPPRTRQAWLAYQSGQLEQARALYRAELADAPANIDALNGLAALALRAGRPDEAATLFARALQANPDDPTALAGLSSLDTAAGSGAPTGESRLKSAIARQPEAPALHFALGNSFARERRWAEAQASYFRAYDLDPGNPDYLFNLAVSLDHLGRRELAGRFYRDALSAANTRPPAFDPDAARARLAGLGDER